MGHKTAMVHSLWLWVGLLCLWAVSGFDLEWSLAARNMATAGIPVYLTGEQVQYALAFMDRSLFEGQGIGAGDLPILLQIGAFLAYGCTYSSIAPRAFRAYRGVFAYMWVTALLTAGGVHLFKGLVARPRPFDVMTDGSLFRPWYSTHMPSFFAFGRGSFPSGHTASVMTLWSTVLLLKRRWPTRTLTTASWAVLCLFLGLSMAFARVAHGDHWPTDTLAAIILTITTCVLVARVMLPPTPGFEHSSAGPTRDPKEPKFTPHSLTPHEGNGPLGVLLLGIGGWLILGLFYEAVKLFLNQEPVLGVAAFFVSLGGGYGIIWARSSKRKA